MDEILNMLAEGDLRSIGRVQEILELVEDCPELFPEVVKAMAHQEPGIRMRASDAVEKISRSKPDYLQIHKTFLLKQLMTQTQQEVRWHLVQILPRLDLSPVEKVWVADVLFTFLEDSSKIVQANTLQALVELSWENDELFFRVRAAVEKMAEIGSPAVSSRAGKLLPLLNNDPD